MGSLRIFKTMPPLTPEQEKRLAELEKMPDSEIDYSDIPKLTDDDWKRMRRVSDIQNYRKVAN